MIIASFPKDAFRAAVDTRATPAAPQVEGIPARSCGRFHATAPHRGGHPAVAPPIRRVGLHRCDGRTELGTVTSASSPSELRVVMLTEPSKRADAMLDALRERGVPVEAVVVDRGILRHKEKLTRTRQVWRRSGLADVAIRTRRRLRRALTNRDEKDAAHGRYIHLANSVFTVDDVNGADSERLIGRLGPDLIVLGKSRILQPHIFRIPRIGVLNVHPGLLPEYRGVDVIAWAIRNDDPLGVSVHWVDAGIDTGPIVARVRFAVEHGDTLSSLRQRGDTLAAQLTADVVAAIAAGERVESVEQQLGAGKLYTRMPPAMRREVEGKLADRWSRNATIE